MSALYVYTLSVHFPKLGGVQGCYIQIGVGFWVTCLQCWALLGPRKASRYGYRFLRFFFLYGIVVIYRLNRPVRGISWKEVYCYMEPIGKVIKNKVEEQGRSIQWLADKLSCHRSNIYNIFNRENIDVSLLIRISSILQYNFLKDIAGSVDDDLK